MGIEEKRIKVVLRLGKLKSSCPLGEIMKRK